MHKCLDDKHIRKAQTFGDRALSHDCGALPRGHLYYYRQEHHGSDWNLGVPLYLLELKRTDRLHLRDRDML